MKNFYPKVSIVIPVYNGAKYLGEAIDSALAQTYKNTEVIVVNDGSNDNGATEKIAKSYGNKIKYYKKENGGVATALNLGIEKMTGEYFSWLSHDDMYYPEKVEKQIDFINKLEDKKVVLYSNYSILVGDKITPIVHNHEMLNRKKKYSLLRGCVNGITVLVPKSLIDEIGEFNPKLKCTQDYDYWRRIQKKYEFIHMEDVLSTTRLHPNQDSVSPVAKAEGNKLWIDMVKCLADEEKVKYESTLYNFYFEMIKFLEQTPYKQTLEYCEQQLSDIEKDYQLDRKKYKVSVIIPFFNRAKQTIASVKSALNQTYKNIEIILVNDASTDDISDIIKFIKDYSNIKLINIEKNSGPATARNIGIEQANGDYIAFLDSDDEFLESKIADQLGMMIKHNLNISYTSYIRREAEKDTIMRDGQLTGIVVPKIINGASIATPTVIVSNRFLKDNNIRFNQNIRVGEDSCFWLNIARYSEILLVDKPLTIVNFGEDSHVSDSTKLAEGVKNIITYLLNDDYYSNFSYDISLLCNYFFKINNDINQKKQDLLLPKWLVGRRDVSFRKGRAKIIVKNSIPYRVARKISHEGPLVALKVIINKISSK